MRESIVLQISAWSKSNSEGRQLRDTSSSILLRKFNQVSRAGLISWIIANYCKPILNLGEMINDYLSLFMSLIVYDITYIQKGQDSNYLKSIENQSKRPLTLILWLYYIGDLGLRSIIRQSVPTTELKHRSIGYSFRMPIHWILNQKLIV